MHPLLGIAWNVVVLYFLMGFRRFSHALSAIVEAFRGNDVVAARRAIAAWRGGYTAELASQDVARLAIEKGSVDAYRQVFAALFWFTVLPGLAGAVLYRAALLLAQEWRGSEPGDDDTPIARSRAAFGAPARKLLWLLDWVPVRLTALSFAVVGDFEDAAWCWRMQPQTWVRQEGGEEMGVVLAAGAGALGVQVGGPLAATLDEPTLRPELGGEPPEPEVLPSAIGLRVASADPVAARDPARDARELRAGHLAALPAIGKRSHRAGSRTASLSATIVWSSASRCVAPPRRARLPPARRNRAPGRADNP